MDFGYREATARARAVHVPADFLLRNSRQQRTRMPVTVADEDDELCTLSAAENALLDPSVPFLDQVDSTVDEAGCASRLPFGGHSCCSRCCLHLE